jgi:hypothetical protein
VQACWAKAMGKTAKSIDGRLKPSALRGTTSTVPKAPYKHPSVFVGCSYKPKKVFDKLRQALGRNPLEFVDADNSISTHHVLERVRRGVTRTSPSARAGPRCRGGTSPTG